MKIDADIEFTHKIGNINCRRQSITVDLDYIDDYDDLIIEVDRQLFHQYGVSPRYLYDYFIANMDDIIDEAS